VIENLNTGKLAIWRGSLRLLSVQLVLDRRSTAKGAQYFHFDRMQDIVAYNIGKDAETLQGGYPSFLSSVAIFMMSSAL
jgi:hypothetical protein